MPYTFSDIHRSFFFRIRIRKNSFIWFVSVTFIMHDFTVVIFFFRILRCNQCRMSGLFISSEMRKFFGIKLFFILSKEKSTVFTVLLTWWGVQGS